MTDLPPREFSSHQLSDADYELIGRRAFDDLNNKALQATLQLRFLLFVSAVIVALFVAGGATIYFVVDNAMQNVRSVASDYIKTQVNAELLNAAALQLSSRPEFASKVAEAIALRNQVRTVVIFSKTDNQGKFSVSYGNEARLGPGEQIVGIIVAIRHKVGSGSGVWHTLDISPGNDNAKMENYFRWDGTAIGGRIYNTSDAEVQGASNYANRTVRIVAFVGKVEEGH